MQSCKTLPTDIFLVNGGAMQVNLTHYIVLIIIIIIIIISRLFTGIL